MVLDVSLTPCDDGLLAFAATSQHGYLSLIRNDTGAPSTAAGDCTSLAVYSWNRQAQYAALLQDVVVVLTTTFELEVGEIDCACPAIHFVHVVVFKQVVWCTLARAHTPKPTPTHSPMTPSKVVPLDAEFNSTSIPTNFRPIPSP